MPAGFRVLAVVAALAVLASPAQKRKNEEPKSQVQPLPPEPPMALSALTNSLDFHISPVLKTGGLMAQIRQSLNNLLRDTRGETIVKLRAFVAGTGDARQVQSTMAGLFTEHKLPLPVLSILQVGGLGDRGEQVVIEAVVATQRDVNPEGLAFFFGQRGSSFPAALEKLKASIQQAGVPDERILSSTCFTSDLGDFAEANASLHALFPHAGINIVQAVRDPTNDAANCEAIGQLQMAPKQPVEQVPGANATLVAAHQLVFTGLQLSFGNYLDDAHEAFQRLVKAAQGLGSVAKPVEVEAFSLDPYAASALRKSNSLAPGVLDVQTVEGLSAIDATGAIEAILASDSGGSASTVKSR